MNKRLFICFIVFLVTFSSLYAQEAENSTASNNGLVKSYDMNASIYPFRVEVLKIFVCKNGYIVRYKKGSVETADTYIPVSWFTPGGKASLHTGMGAQYPYMIVYKKNDGSFSHVKLFALKKSNDSTWRAINGDFSDKFNVTEVKLEFDYEEETNKE